MRLTWSEALAEVRKFSEFSIILFLSKESARTTVACVYMDDKRLMEPRKMQNLGAEVNNPFFNWKQRPVQVPSGFATSSNLRLSYE